MFYSFTCFVGCQIFLALFFPTWMERICNILTPISHLHPSPSLQNMKPPTGYFVGRRHIESSFAHLTKPHHGCHQVRTPQLQNLFASPYNRKKMNIYITSAIKTNRSHRCQLLINVKLWYNKSNLAKFECIIGYYGPTFQSVVSLLKPPLAVRPRRSRNRRIRCSARFWPQNSSGSGQMAINDLQL